MASNSESEQILEMAIAGISRVAQAIAAMPAEDRARALEAAERSYCQTALDLGYGETQAESWAAALMFRLRAKSKANFGEVKAVRTLVPTTQEKELFRTVSAFPRQRRKWQNILRSEGRAKR